MYANRYDPSAASHPISAGAALLVNGVLITGLIFAVPTAVRLIPEKVLITTQVPLPPPPDPDPVRKVEKTPTTPTTPPLHVRDPIVPLPPTGPKLDTTTELVRPSFDPPAVPGPGTTLVDPPAPAPVLVDAMVDPNHAANFQPDYPGSELRLNREGVVKVRVRIGADGRIKDVEPLSSPSAAFFDATRRHALARWRFRPATRDGVAVESWKEMTVRFRITN